MFKKYQIFNKLNIFLFNFLGLVDNELALDGKPFSILSYANGQGYEKHFKAKNDTVIRLDMSDEDYLSFGFDQPANAPLEKESHSGADVGIFAIGDLISLILALFGKI